ncbi:MAG: cation diffusion facilitator family transporter [Chthoniobacterales bacterium]|jgi:cation diffusion facilitator family transporter
MPACAQAAPEDKVARRDNAVDFGPPDALSSRMGEHLPAPTGATEKLRAMSMSVVAGLFLLGLKAGAYWWTGSTAILSDLGESLAHMAAVGFAAYSLWLSLQPADTNHLYGHAKIGFFSAGFEGAMIMAAAIYILYEAWAAAWQGPRLDHIPIGLALTAGAAVLNGALGWHLVRTGRLRGSIILEANGHHVLTDCWTSLGVLIALGLVLLTGWLYWDPLFAAAAAINILVAGFRLIRRSVSGLMDAADPEMHELIERVVSDETSRRGISHHNLRHRNVGDAHLVELHLVFPANELLRDAHRIATEIEEAVEAKIQPAGHVITHLECEGDHAGGRRG